MVKQLFVIVYMSIACGYVQFIASTRYSPALHCLDGIRPYNNTYEPNDPTGEDHQFHSEISLHEAMYQRADRLNKFTDISHLPSVSMRCDVPLHLNIKYRAWKLRWVVLLLQKVQFHTRTFKNKLNNLQ